MEQPFLSIEEFNDLLNGWIGHHIKVSKQEIDDFDEVLIELNTISYSKADHNSDDYEPMYALQLNGVGKVKTDSNIYQALPTSVYEIPLEDTSLYQFDGSCFSLTTDRGVYTIEIAMPTD